jgi:hypothetical protein
VSHGTSNERSLLADVLQFLRDTHQADVVAAAEWDKMTRGKLPFTEEHQAMKTFRRREALLARIESSAAETTTERPVAWRRLINSAYEKHARYGYSEDEIKGGEPLYARPPVKAEAECNGKCVGHSSEASLSGWAADPACPKHGSQMKTGAPTEPACPKCKTLLAFEGDTCWACSKEERL